MLTTPHPYRVLAAAAAAAWLAFLLASAAPALAQKTSRYAAEITQIDVAKKQVTLKASMGQQSMRVATGVALDAIKPGDKVLLTFGQEGTEAVITSIEVIK